MDLADGLRDWIGMPTENPAGTNDWAGAEARRGGGLLDSALNRSLAVNSQLFRWNVAYARLAGLLGEPGAQQRAARKALRLAEEGPVLPRQPTVGVVQADEETLAWLRGVAGGR